MSQITPASEAGVVIAITINSLLRFLIKDLLI